jgi:transcriptional regulator with XRE-family HTH domain
VPQWFALAFQGSNEYILDMPTAKELGEALKFLRSRRGWPQKQLAARSKVTKGMVSSYERGKQTPTLYTLAKMARALDADLCDFYCALEIVNGRPADVHGLSAQFQPGQPRPAKLASRRPSDGPTARASARDPGGEAESEPQLPADLERALSEMITGGHKLLRHLLSGIAKPR